MAHLNFRKYNILLLSCGAIATLVMFFYAMLFGHLNSKFWIFRCDASLYSNEYYLSYIEKNVVAFSSLKYFYLDYFQVMIQTNLMLYYYHVYPYIQENF